MKTLKQHLIEKTWKNVYKNKNYTQERLDKILQKEIETVKEWLQEHANNPETPVQFQSAYDELIEELKQ